MSNQSNELGMRHCGVIGNPIAHSLSPQIHQQFADQLNLNLDYQRFLLNSDTLKPFIKRFFAEGGIGLNVTLPFKQAVLPLVDHLSRAASLCQSVNTLWRDNNGQIHGDSTDGAGLIMDLERLNYTIRGKSVLVIGAGGAAMAVVQGLLRQGAKVTMHNRTAAKIDDIQQQTKSIGKVKRFANNTDEKFDGIICGLSEFNQELLSPSLKHLCEQAFVYDLNYGERATSTLSYFKQNGVERLSDGYGMLVGQAACSFKIWHHELPDINSVLNNHPAK
jgi:shikimate dehydrogenase